MTAPRPQSFSAGGDERLRGVRLDSVLRRRGAILRASTGDDRTYQLSTPVRRLDAFLSHTWSTPLLEEVDDAESGVQLWRGLGVGSPRVASWSCGALFWQLLSSSRHWSQTPPVSDILVGRIARYCATSFFTAVLHFGVDVTSLVPRRWRRSPMVFLDKVCIHQTDPQIKAEGIANLDIFAARSDKFVILRADDYLERLWTVYEFGSVLLLQNLPNITVSASGDCATAVRRQHPHDQ